MTCRRLHSQFNFDNDMQQQQQQFSKQCQTNFRKYKNVRLLVPRSVVLQIFRRKNKNKYYTCLTHICMYCVYHTFTYKRTNNIASNHQGYWWSDISATSSALPTLLSSARLYLWPTDSK